LHYDLGFTCTNQGLVLEALRHFAAAVSLRPNSAVFQVYLGIAYRAAGDSGQAIACFRKCIELEPNYRYAHQSLATALWDQKRAETLAACQDRLPDVVAGKARPAGVAEALAMAGGCGKTNRYWAEAALYAWALGADPKLAAMEDDPGPYALYFGAVAAARAGTGQGSDAPPEADRPQLRQQALAWLQEWLAINRRHLDGRPAATACALVQFRTNYWLHDEVLAAVRDDKPLARLPEAERRDWLAFWAAVRQLRDQAAPVKK
jgi:tetratricopeptide (TPR) repeat protein